MEVTLGNYIPQLSGFGIDYHSIPEPLIAEKEEGGGYRGKITLTEGNRFAITFDYDYMLIEIIKKLKGKYNGHTKTWYIPMNNKTRHFIFALVQNDNFYCTSDVKRIVEEISEKYKAIQHSGDSITNLIYAIEEYLDHEADDDYQVYRIALIDCLERVKEESGEQIEKPKEKWISIGKDGRIIG